VNPFPLVLAEFRHNRLGSAAIIALISIAVALGVALSAQERALRQASARAADRFDLVVGAAGSPTQLVLTTVYVQPAALELLPPSTLSRVQDDPRVAMAAPVAVTDSYAGHAVVGTTADFATDGGRIGVSEGRRFIRVDEALVGSAVTIPVGRRIRPAHGAAVENLLESHEHDAEFTIVGRLAATGTPWDRAIIIPIEATWAMHDAKRIPGMSSADAGTDVQGTLGPPWRPGRFGPTPAIVVRPRSVGDAYQLRQDWRGGGTVAVFPAEVLVELYGLLGNAREILGALSLVFDLLLIAAALLVIVAVVAGRRQSVGALRALGAPAAYVFAAIWLYGAVLVGSGIVLGFAAGSVLARVLGRVLGGRMGMDIAAVPGWHEATLAIALLVSGALLAALPSLAMFRVPVRRLLQGT
jgi:putative ABC transport system permease protein